MAEASVLRGPNTIEYKIGEIFGEIKNKIQSGYNLREIIDHIDELRFRSQTEKHELSHLYEAKIKNMGNAGRNGGEYYTPRPLIRAIVQVVKPKIGDKIYDGAVGSAGFLCEAFEYLSAKPGLTTKDVKTLQERTFYGKEKKSLAYVIAIMNMILHGIEAPNIIHTNTLTERRGVVPGLHRLRESCPKMPFDLSGLFGEGISTTHTLLGYGFFMKGQCTTSFQQAWTLTVNVRSPTIRSGERSFTCTAFNMPTLEKYKAKILRFYRKHKRMPSYSELAELCGFKSKNAAHKLVARLLALGAVAKDAGGRLIPQKLSGDIRVLGIVEAGWPSPAEEALIDTMNLNEFLVGNKEATYMLEVSGDSMIDAGIMPGDLVLVERGVDPKDGDIVIAEVDGDWTIKYFRKRGKEVTLVPGNKKYKPIVPTTELNIAAVVKAQIRKY